jgi:hypothetical protein
MLGNDIYNVGSLNATGWLNSTYLNGTYYGDGSSLQSLNTFNATYDALTALTSFANYNYLQNDVTAPTTNYVSVMTLPLTNGKKVLIECMLYEWANATTTGVRLRTSVTGTSSQKHQVEYYTSAIAQALCQGAATTLACDATASSGTTVSPARVYVYTVQSSAGTFTLELRSELAGPPISVNITSGSWCRSIEK